MYRMLRRMLLVAGLVGSLAAFGTVSANHQHQLVTPGTCVENIARGQTAKTENEPGGHKFHDNVHRGTPGNEVFADPNHPVHITLAPC